MKVPTFDGHLNESNTDLRRCSMEYTPRRKLTREFKLEAVRQTALSEKPKAQVARELGVRVGQLRTWRLEFEKEAVTGIAKPDRSAAEDLEQLRQGIAEPHQPELHVRISQRPLAERHHLHTDEGRLALPGCGSGRILESFGGLGDEPNSGHQAGDGRVEHGHRSSRSTGNAAL